MLFKSLLLLLWTIFKVSTDFATIFPLGFLWLRDTWGPSSLTRDWTCIPWHWRVKLQPWTSSQVPWAFQETKSRVSRIRHMVEMFTLSNVAYSVLISPSARSGSHLSLYPPPPSTLFLPEFILSLFFFHLSSQLFISFSKLSSKEENYLVFEDCFWMCSQLSDKGDHSLVFPFSNHRVYWEGVKIFLLPAWCENKVSRIKLPDSGVWLMPHAPRSYEVLVHSESTISYW